MAQGLGLTAAGRSCWELGSLTLRMTAKGQWVLPVAMCPVRRCASSSWILFVRPVGWTRAMAPQPGLLTHIETFVGLVKAQVPGPSSGWASGRPTHSQEQLGGRAGMGLHSTLGKLWGNHWGCFLCSRRERWCWNPLSSSAASALAVGPDGVCLFVVCF